MMAEVSDSQYVAIIAHLGDNRAALAAERAHARDEAALAAEGRTPAPVKPAQKRDLQP